ncbi:hypothetical protein WMF01_39205 [Sorangium sp. So ce1667]
MAKLTWKLIPTDNSNNNDIETWRAEIPGGWLVSVWAARDRANATGTPVPGGSNWGGGVTFVPDPGHDKWVV